MKLLITLYNLDNAKELLTNASGLVIGLKDFSTRETSYLTTEEFKEISRLTKSLNKELYISLKPLLFNEQVKDIKQLFNQIKDLYFTGVIVGDLGYYYLLKELEVKNIIYNPETLLTNIEDINEAYSVGFKGAFISKEILLKDIKKIIEEKNGDIYLTAHGYLNMFYSKRKLIKNYFKETNISHAYLNKQTLKLKERKREGYYPIIEDKFGTHIFRKSVSTVLYQLEQLKGVDYLLIDSIFHDDNYTKQILSLFVSKINETKIEQLKKDYDEQWDEGFLFTKTIYKKD